MPFTASAADSENAFAGVLSWPRSLTPFLPPQTTRLFAQSALLQPAEAAAESFDAMLAALDGDFVGFLSDAGRELRGHLPQLFTNLRGASANLPEDLTPYLKTATLRAKLRFEIFEKCLIETIGHLNSFDAPYVATKGVVASVTGYSAPFLRHCHDFDLVVSRQHQAGFAAHLERQGYSSVAHHGSALRLDHPVGLPVMLHCEPLEGPLSADADWLLEGRRIMDTAFGTLSVPMPAKAVLHSCLHGQWAHQRHHHNWIWDATLMLRGFTPEDSAALARLAKPPEAQLSLDYLRNTIPSLPALEALKAPGPAAATVNPFSVDYFAANGLPDLRQRINAARSQSQRLSILAQRIWPPDWYFGKRGAMDPAQLRRRRIKRIGQVIYWRGLMPIRRLFKT